MPWDIVFVRLHCVMYDGNIALSIHFHIYATISVRPMITFPLTIVDWNSLNFLIKTQILAVFNAAVLGSTIRHAFAFIKVSNIKLYLSISNLSVSIFSTACFTSMGKIWVRTHVPSELIPSRVNLLCVVIKGHLNARAFNKLVIN